MFWIESVPNLRSGFWGRQDVCSLVTSPGNQFIGELELPRKPNFTWQLTIPHRDKIGVLYIRHEDFGDSGFSMINDNLESGPR